MSIYDPTDEQILHFFATNTMWSDDQSGDSDAPSGYFGRMSIETVEEAAALISEWQQIGLGMVTDVKPAELLGDWLVQTDSQGFHYVTGYPNYSTLVDAFAELELTYADWLDDEYEGSDYDYLDDDANPLVGDGGPMDTDTTTLEV